MKRGTAHHLSLSAVLIALVLGAFLGGWWIGRASRIDTDIEVRLARIEERLDAARKARDSDPPAAPREGALAGTASGAVHSLAIGDSPVSGAADAPVTIVEFADFECPFSAGAHPTLERILAAYPGKVRLVFKHNPLPVHGNALLAHRAAVAAHRQGKFWEMHDLLFSSQERLDRESLKSHAGALGLDLRSFEAALASPESTQAVSADMSQAGRLGVGGVPAFFINGRFLPGAQPFDVFQELIEQELQAKG